MKNPHDLFIPDEREAFKAEGAKWDKIILWVGLTAVISALAIIGFGG